jgi:L-ascorbate metabolism protein UlaG (beta-lactamase superfamily)
MTRRWSAIALLTGLLLFLVHAAHAACTPIAQRGPMLWRASTAEPTLTISFLGHASFLIESPQGVRAVTDYRGLFGPPTPPDIVTMNRAHSTHYTPYPDARIPYILRGWGEDGKPARHNILMRDMRVTNLPTNIRDWGGGTLINANSVFIFESAGLCVAHLGHLHHLLEPADLDALGRIDVLMIMIDGGYSLGHRDAVALIEQIHPRVVLPMHYFSEFNLNRFFAFMREKDFAIELRERGPLTLSRATLPAKPVVIALPGPH